MQTVIFDLDGTLANIKHRRVYLDETPPNWQAFNRNMKDDAPNVSVVELYKTLWNTGKYNIVIVSGRSNEFRKFTEQWLFWNKISYSQLLMREKDDFRSDHLIKEDILKKLKSIGSEIAFVVDDRQQVVDMWRRNGITCLQCDYGDF